MKMPMKHFVYLKIAGEKYDQGLAELMEQTMRDVQKELQGFQGYQVLRAARNVSDTDSVLIELTFENQQVQELYLAHPLHVAMLQQIKPDLVDKAAFDA